MSFSDPRDGDLEDDASSTSRHSLLGHASRMLLEISLPKLVLAAVMLLVVPALLLGAAPKVVLWLTETAWHGVARFGLIIALASFAIIAGVASWRWGRLLFRVVERNFWALNAGLVQPLYTALREATRLALETAAPGRPLAAMRRDAGLAAGALIALLGAAVAWWAGPLPTLRVAAFGAGDLVGIALDAIRNGVWVIAVYLMVGAPAWSIAEALAGTPEDIGPPVAGEARWRVAHLSDIHIVGDEYGFRLECGRDGPRGNSRLDRVLELLEAEDAVRRIDVVLITGDITDAARNAEFIAFEDALARHPSLRDRILIIPGNHDVNIVDRANPSRLELPIAPGGPLRRLRFLSAMARLQGRRVRVVDHDTQRVGPTFDAWLAQDGRGETLARFMDDGGLRAGLAARATWNEAFPLIAPPATPDGLGVVLLDSNAETHFSFTNALGILGMSQLRAAEAAMREWPQARWLVALHHHLVEYPRPGASLADRIGTALVNGHWVLRRLRRHARRIVVLHGHRHFDWMGRSGDLRIISAPSPVMGALDREGRYFWLHALAPAADGGLALLAPQRIEVPGAEPLDEGG
ncbi:metallophosphoesterase [Roseomonas sp. CAU 1739]|uniref:metallophosphoesterase family protein n=1 Tax=Roseomonas sp. CAU 1739 TaxID=3140364 RepID=UPI00325AA12C